MGSHLDQLCASRSCWLPTVEALRLGAPWELVVRCLQRVDPAGGWTKPKLVRAIKGLAQIGLADAERLLARARPLPPDDALAKLVAAIVRGRPDITIRRIGAELEALGERTPRGSRTWTPSSVRYR